MTIYQIIFHSSITSVIASQVDNLSFGAQFSRALCTSKRKTSKRRGICLHPTKNTDDNNRRLMLFTFRTITVRFFAVTTLLWGFRAPCGLFFGTLVFFGERCRWSAMGFRTRISRTGSVPRGPWRRMLLSKERAGWKIERVRLGKGIREDTAPDKIDWWGNLVYWVTSREEYANVGSYMHIDGAAVLT